MISNVNKASHLQFCLEAHWAAIYKSEIVGTGYQATKISEENPAKLKQEQQFSQTMV
jgi:hypothetical protein